MVGRWPQIAREKYAIFFIFILALSRFGKSDDLTAIIQESLFLKGSPLRRFRWFAAVSLFAAALPVACQTPRTKRVTDAEVAAITRDAILIDTHDDVTSRT